MMSSLLFILHLVTYVQSFASGPPVIANPEICDDMFPSGHNVTPQTGPSPYRIIFNTNNCYSNANLPITGSRLFKLNNYIFLTRDHNSYLNLTNANIGRLKASNHVMISRAVSNHIRTCLHTHLPTHVPRCTPRSKTPRTEGK